ncbi:MAG TPA: biopolymer transporter ExbD [Pirellulales bacterium]|jgi:biopolymer transport protein ExbD
MSGGNAESGAPNLTPILDMVFQLITFFMLVMNVKAASLDLAIKLPVLGSAIPTEAQELETLVLNISKDGKVKAYGSEQSPADLARREADLARRKAQVAGKPLEPTDEIPITVVIRADRETPFHAINAIITDCQQNGFRRFQYRAMSKVSTSPGEA